MKSDNLNRQIYIEFCPSQKTLLLFLSIKKQKRRPPMTYIPNENARNLPTFSINKESIKRPKKPSVDFGGFVPLTRRGPLMIEENYRRPTNRIPLRPNFQKRY